MTIAEIIKIIRRNLQLAIALTLLLGGLMALVIGFPEERAWAVPALVAIIILIVVAGLALWRIRQQTPNKSALRT